MEPEFRNSGVKLRAMGVESSRERMGVETRKEASIEKGSMLRRYFPSDWLSASEYIFSTDMIAFGSLICMLFNPITKHRDVSIKVTLRKF